MSPITEAYLAGIGTSIFAVLVLLAVIEIISIAPSRSRDVLIPTARQMRREMRARAIKRVA